MKWFYLTSIGHIFNICSRKKYINETQGVIRSHELFKHAYRNRKRRCRKFIKSEKNKIITVQIQVKLLELDEEYNSLKLTWKTHSGVCKSRPLRREADFIETGRKFTFIWNRRKDKTVSKTHFHGNKGFVVYFERR